MTTGEWRGQSIQLRPWQREIVNGLFELGADGRRTHRIGYIGLPRKNGKSTLCAALAIYGLVADNEPGAQVYSCAGDRKQAEIVFTDAKRMVEADPELRQLVKVQRYHMEVPSTNSVYRVLSADAALQQGLNPSFVVFDEVHVQPNEDLWTAMTLGSGTRRQPLIIGITTAGFDEETLAGRLYAYGKKVESGEVNDPSFFFRWWEPKDTNADYRDPAVWAEANPAYGDFLKPEDFEITVRTATESQFRRFKLNQWVQAEEAWLPFGAWDACYAPSIELSPELPLYVGVDMARTVDTAAVALAQKQWVDGRLRVVMRVKVWSNPYPENHSAYHDWNVPYGEVESYLRDLYVQYPLAAGEIDERPVLGPAYYCDPSLFVQEIQALTRDGFNVVKMPNHASILTTISQTFYDLVVTGQVAHDGDKVLARHIANAVAKPTFRGWRIDRPEGRRKPIDACVAGALAAYGAQINAPDDGPSIYETRGLLMV